MSAVEISAPYLMFLGDVHDQLAAKTATGVVYWRKKDCIGQLRFEGCGADAPFNSSATKAPSTNSGSSCC